MEFRMQTALPHPPARVWLVMVDIARIAGCIPGCEQVEERQYLARYTAVMKQKVGPFKLEVPVEIVVEEHEEPRIVRARASGKDKFTRTHFDVHLDVQLQAPEADKCELTVLATLQVAGRLASLGYSIIKKKADENFLEFEQRFLAQLEAI